MTVHTGTPGLTLGVRVHLRIAEMEITNYKIISYYRLLYTHNILLYTIYIYYYYIIHLFSKNSTLSNGYGSDHNAVW